MENFYFSSMHKSTKWLCMIVFTFIILLIMLGIYCLFLDVCLGCFVIGLGLFLAYNVCVLSRYLLRMYALNEDGITVQYPCRKRVFYPWSSITNICLYVVHPGKGRNIEDQVIWCTAGRVKREPPNMSRRWRDADYLCHHYKSVLTIEFTEERLAMFKKYYGRDIPDYRDEVYR